MNLIGHFTLLTYINGNTQGTQLKDITAKTLSDNQQTQSQYTDVYPLLYSRYLETWLTKPKHH